jgi:hypothetical protein
MKKPSWRGVREEYGGWRLGRFFHSDSFDFAKPVPLIGGVGLVELEELPPLVGSILAVFDVVFSI